MSNDERARDYAALYSSITAGGGNWRHFVPTDGQAHRVNDEMVLDGHRVVRRDGVSGWDVVALTNGGDT